MISKIELILNDSGHFVVSGGGVPVITDNLKEALQYIMHFSKHLAFFPQNTTNSMYANPVPYSEFLKNIKKEKK